MDRSINHALVRQTTTMERSAARTTLAVHQMSAMHSYAASKASTTVTLAHHLVTAATYSGRMNPAKLAEFRQLTEAYLDEMTYITEEVSYQIIRQLAK